MTLRPGTALLAALVPGLAVATGGEPACIALAAHPEGGVVAQFDVPAASPWFTVAYVHSVTRTPVVERYRVFAHDFAHVPRADGCEGAPGNRPG